MSTTLPLTNNATNKPIFQRFLWKEFRMLRGFWLAVGVLAVIVQLVMPHLMFDSQVAADALFAIAWGAAALYAVGAAITLFSAEREEETLDFLVLLPGRWLPMFLGKVMLAMLSAVALALVLSLIGWLIAGGSWPTQAAISETLGVAGVAVVEATAWGLLFSLWMKQPLLAAILSMAAASFGAQLSVAATSQVSQAFTSTAYAQAAPMRLLVCLAVFLIDVWLASRWLQPAHGASLGSFKWRRVVRNAANPMLAQGASVGVDVKASVRRRVLARLLWQTWRESWRTMLAAVPIALLLMHGVVMTTWLGGPTELAALFCPLILPALFGALVFRADQRRGHRQFLVAHAGRPRYVWFARHAVWLSTLSLLGWLLQLGGSLLAANRLHEQMHFALRYLPYGSLQTPWSMACQVQFVMAAFWSVTSVGWCALLAAYGLGQLCSMLLRREVLAGFLAILFATVLTAWAMVVRASQLNPGWYVLSIGLVAMMATWLRAPDWIVGRNRLRAWLAPLLVMVLPFAIILTTVPKARLDQIPFSPPAKLYRYLQEPLQASLHDLKSSRAAALQTATGYEQLIASFEASDLDQESRELVFERVDALSRQAVCEFPGDVVLMGSPKWSELYNLKQFLLDDTKLWEADSELEKAFERILAIARIDGQIVSRQSTNRGSFFQNQTRDYLLANAMLQWAQHPDQTSRAIKDSIAQLRAVFESYPDPRKAVLADYLSVRDVLLDKQPPTFLRQNHRRSVDYLPLLQNMLRWERQRALQALDLLTTQNLNYVDAVSHVVHGGDVWKFHDRSTRYELRDFLQHSYETREVGRLEPLCEGDWDDFVRMQKIAAQCRTSYLVTDELSRHGDLADYLTRWIDTQIAQQGLLTQLALIAYRLDHKAYPEQLEELVPDYLDWQPRDPYSGQTFKYRPEGLELPFRPNLLAKNTIAAGTPMFWSVSVTNYRLVQEQAGKDESLADNRADQEEASERELVYLFRPTGGYWCYYLNLVFPLPTSEPNP